MSNLGSELELPLEDLIQLHTGRRSSGSSECSDLYSTSDSLDEPNFCGTQYSCEDDSSFLATDEATVDFNLDPFVLNIARQLEQSIKPNYCSICDKNCGPGSFGHYLAAPHRQTINNWVKIKLGNLKNVVSVTNIYCEACNLALPEADLVKNHYQSERHLRMVDKYCFICKKNVNNMEMHLKSKQHAKHCKVIYTQPQLHNFIKPSVVKTAATSKSGGKLIALELKKMLSSEYCHVCKQSTHKTVHYKTKKHVTQATKWIKNEFGFGEEEIKSVFCGACNEVFCDPWEGKEHYDSPFHKSNSHNYCNMCKKHVKYMDKHLNTNTHLRLKNKGSEETNEAESIASESDKGSSEDSCDLSEKVAYLSLADNLGKMLTVTHCAICNEDVNIHVNDHHYLQKAHLIAVGSWVCQELRLFKVKNPKLFYCEACLMNLCGTSKALEHYRNATHIYNEKTYCPTCLFRGTPSDVIRHNSTEHQDTIHVFEEAENCKPEVIERATLENTEESTLRHKIQQELTKIIDKVYFSKKIPLEDALVYLKNLNKDILCMANSNDQHFLDLPPLKPKIYVQDCTQEYAKLKLTMEMRRLKLVLENNTRIRTEFAFQYVRNLNELVQNLTKSARFDDVSDAFEVVTDLPFMREAKSERFLREELNKLENSLINEKKLDVEVALDCITQFNVQLESLIQYQEDTDSDDGSFD